MRRVLEGGRSISVASEVFIHWFLIKKLKFNLKKKQINAGPELVLLAPLPSTAEKSWRRPGAVSVQINN